MQTKGKHCKKAQFSTYLLATLQSVMDSLTRMKTSRAPPCTRGIAYSGICMDARHSGRSAHQTFHSAPHLQESYSTGHRWRRGHWGIHN